MSYTVEITEPARDDFRALFAFIAQQSERGAEAWEAAFEKAIQALETQPLACSLAPEDADHAAEIRQFLFKTRSGLPYRGLFTVADETVYILHLRGPGQDLMGPDDLQLPN